MSIPLPMETGGVCPGMFQPEPFYGTYTLAFALLSNGLGQQPQALGNCRNKHRQIAVTLKAHPGRSMCPLGFPPSILCPSSLPSLFPSHLPSFLSFKEQGLERTTTARLERVCMQALHVGVVSGPREWGPVGFAELSLTTHLS